MEDRRSGARGPALWLKAARAPFFTASLGPVAVGIALAYHHTGAVNWLTAMLTLVALVALHAGANMANDYFDHRSGADPANASYASPFTGGSRVIQDGLVSPLAMLLAALTAISLGCAIGLYLAWVAGWPILLLGVIGAVTGFFYTAPPLRLIYRGGGEVFIFLDFGVLPVLGAYYVQARTMGPATLMASLPTALLITGVLWINQFQDMAADAAVGKRHWVVRLGRRRAAWVHVVMLALSQVLVAVGVIGGLLPSWALLGLLGLPLAAQAARVTLQAYDDLPHLTPANAATVGCHLLTSLGMALGCVLAGGP